MNLGFAGRLGLLREMAFSVLVMICLYYFEAYTFSFILRSPLFVLNSGEEKGFLWNICKTVFILFCIYALFVTLTMKWGLSSYLVGCIKTEIHSKSSVYLVVILTGANTTLHHLIKICLSVFKNIDSSYKLTIKGFLNFICLNLFCSIIRETSRIDALTNQWHNTDDFHSNIGINYFEITRDCSTVVVVPQVTLHKNKTQTRVVC